MKEMEGVCRRRQVGSPFKESSSILQNRLACSWLTCERAERVLGAERAGIGKGAHGYETVTFIGRSSAY